MFLTPSEQAAQVERFLARIPKGLIHDAARPLIERLHLVFPPEALSAIGFKQGTMISEADSAKLSAQCSEWKRDLPQHLSELRGFILWADTALVAKAGTALVAKIKGLSGTPDQAIAACHLFSPVYFVDEEKKLWRFELRLEAERLKIQGRPTSVAELVSECKDPTYGPLSMGHSIMLNQFGGPAKAARERASRLERLIEHVENATRLDEESWHEYEYVVKWDGEPPVPKVIRDVCFNVVRKTYLLREWNAGNEPHMVREFATVQEAIAEANEPHGYLQRRAGGAR